MNWFDYVILIVLLIGALDGMFKGFIVSFFNIAGIFISLFFAKYFTSYLADFVINNTSIYDSLNKIFIKRMTTLNPVTMSIIKLIKNKDTSGSLTTAFINIACFLCIFFMLTILINILKDSVKLKVYKTSLRHIDRAGGFLIGLFKSFIFIFLFFAILTPVIGIIPEKNEFITALGTSKFAKYFFLYNFIIPWIQKLNHI